ncbi:uncharacterized protein LACBIDRAFT_321504 [Laccaria bicolor S238N-H82]|uniref:Predicted protein n=1 Tax=Laccaria bicolor (strain S238N-H82 / ATCC MYA-4686) TaxID=486041 RepID=B0CT39_LACBS|nr:uncharacterized protein LACBIDRAFT_321504 [Laccaria bicolor S238N-H82]EDR14436.1 predicted protein [Laccaria bicolor S238N-H82]|eukprot:XP_001874995.1 predicted protein [Laccaria bicolor S238N-H82]
MNMDPLPASLRAWRDHKPYNNPEWYKPWEQLWPFFLEHGYDLFCLGSGGKASIPGGTSAPALDSFGLYGDRGDEFYSQMGRYPLAFAARDRLEVKNRDVVIKLVAHGDEGLNELKILHLLNSEPLRSDSANLTVQVLEFLSFSDWQFVVMPFYDGCDEAPFLRASECLDFAEQVLSDISHENIVMNHHGKVPGDPFIDIWPPHEFRSTFPVRYYLMDFGCSVHLPPNLPPRDRLIKPFKIAREQCPAEMLGSTKYDPFAADIYVVARVFYGLFRVRLLYEAKLYFQDIVPDVPGLLELLQDMSSHNPSSRISLTVALDRLEVLKSQTPPQVLSQVKQIGLSAYQLIPQNIS